jgi:hypothetical protein
MMSAPSDISLPPRSHAWEKEYTPKITLGVVIAVGSVFAVWIGFLAYIAIDRWTGSLQ